MPDKPVRVQLSRKKGWRMPPNTVSVARPGRWGNPFTVTDKFAPGTIVGARYFAVPSVAEAVACFKVMMEEQKPERWDVTELRGKNLACWCKIINSHGEYSPCHADVLLSLANDIPMDEVIRENTRWAKGEAL